MAYQTALAAVCVEGILFIILAVTGLRLRLIRLVPKSIMLATSAGIGLFLAFIGLQSQEGLGIISYDVGTLPRPRGLPRQLTGKPAEQARGPSQIMCCGGIDMGHSRQRRAGQMRNDVIMRKAG